MHEAQAKKCLYCLILILPYNTLFPSRNSRLVWQEPQRMAGAGKDEGEEEQRDSIGPEQRRRVMVAAMSPEDIVRFFTNGMGAK